VDLSQLLRAWWAWLITLKNYEMKEIKQRIFDNWKTTALGLYMV
jgi:hypothetical protein